MRLGAIRVFSKTPSLSTFSFTSASLRYSSQSYSTRFWFTTSIKTTMASTPATTATGGGEGVQQIDSYKLQHQQQKQQPGKRPFQNGQGGGKGGRGGKFAKKGKKAKPPAEGGHDEVLRLDIEALMAKSKNEAVEGGEGEAATEEAPLPEQGSEVLVEVVALSSTGDGLAKMKGSDRIYVVPFAIPGDMVMVKAYRHEETHTVADFISVVDPSPLRDDSRIQCQYFAKCSGCQFQMLDYAEQLRIKRQTVVKAYQNFSQLPPELVPEILDTIGSPLQYNYRTKLTPHFDGPRNNPRRGPKKFLESCPPVGFTPKSARKVMDIEDCPIATPAVRKGLTDERKRMQTEYSKYSNGATILLRESTVRVPTGSPVPSGIPSDAITVSTPEYTDYKTCITDNNATSVEYIDSFLFTNPAGSFFQNNNSILSPFTQYIREHILPRTNPGSIRYLIDAYSGSGLFTITQSALFPGGSIGIDIAEGSITYARKNAKLNNLDESQCKFIAADAPELFKSASGYNPDETVVVLDPPRKGCDASFLRQLLKFGPRRVVYVSCNVHTQARDVGVLVRGEVDGVVDNMDESDAHDGENKKKKKTRYEIESLRGFDFFPQTSHVEGVAVLNRVEES
ncbi:S-adenosyl-L-methionine-dependent methyltransferase [Apiosordaria backusii]|uniref:tRNA (uracil(54)-C(5))-methyltransferase n=1 Tax=Apiosordaria backusii TaxID=314023 RepID=A0AA40K679_9PEZI|nr:S-adenosyl-L-methionine-dependent methyltransferase [Apiosordaria backusii]